MYFIIKITPNYNEFIDYYQQIRTARFIKRGYEDNNTKDDVNFRVVDEDELRDIIDRDILTSVPEHVADSI